MDVMLSLYLYILGHIEQQYFLNHEYKQPKTMFDCAVRQQQNRERTQKWYITDEEQMREAERSVELLTVLYLRRFMFGHQEQMFIDCNLSKNLQSKCEWEMDHHRFDSAMVSLTNCRKVSQESEWVNADHSILKRIKRKLDRCVARCTCSVCGYQLEDGTMYYLKTCGGCESKNYCGRKCQKIDWLKGDHRLNCTACTE